MAVYCEPWHYDIEKFLTLKQRVGDETQRVHALNTALFLNDEFLRRVENDDAWYLFDPKEVNDLTELYGQKFSKTYQEYCERAEKNQIRMYRKIEARDLFKKILTNLLETSHPWLTFKDAANIRCPIKNVGTIHSSNLCTEVFLPTDREQVAVCNLTSLNLARHLSTENTVDWKKLEETIKLAIRQLDNVIDANYYAIPEAENANKKTRPVGLGVMGLADMFEKMNIQYDSEPALELFDQIIEFISYHAIEASADLAAERGSFPAFAGSEWSKGKVPIDTLNDLDEERNNSVETNRKVQLDWDKPRTKVRVGMRNGTVMAIAPTATISIIAGTTQSIEPTFSNVYSRNNLSGKFIEINENLVSHLKNAGLWEQVSEPILVNRGELNRIQEIPEKLKKLFKTAYSISPYYLIEYAARAQKWIDMGCSRNMYFNSKNLETLEKTYLSAWRKGLKSTYYAYFQTSMHAEASYAYNEQSPQSPRTVLLTKQDDSCNISSGNCSACE